MTAVDGRTSRPTPSQGVVDLADKTAGDLAELMRAELTLAKAELREEMRHAAKGAGALGGAALAAYLGLLLLAFGACWALAMVLPTGAAFGIVGGALLAVGGPLVLVARHAMSDVEGLPETRTSLSEVTHGWHTTHPS